MHMPTIKGFHFEVIGVSEDAVYFDMIPATAARKKDMALAIRGALPTHGGGPIMSFRWQSTLQVAPTFIADDYVREAMTNFVQNRIDSKGGNTVEDPSRQDYITLHTMLGECIATLLNTEEYTQEAPDTLEDIKRRKERPKKELNARKLAELITREMDQSVLDDMKVAAKATDPAAITRTFQDQDKEYRKRLISFQQNFSR